MQIRSKILYVEKVVDRNSEDTQQPIERRKFKIIAEMVKGDAIDLIKHLQNDLDRNLPGTVRVILIGRMN